MLEHKLSHCPLWTSGLYIEKINQSNALVSMCCFQESNHRPYSTIDFHNNDYLNSIRESVKQGLNLKECDSCFINEKFGNQSYRQGQLRVFEDNQIENTDQIELISLLYNCENVCNLKCITCSPRYSSLWKSDYKKLGYSVEVQKLAANKNTLYNSLDFSKLRLIHFQGGEPFMTDDHEGVLSKAYNQGSLDKTTVSYNTNGSIFPNASTVELWKKTKQTKIYFSIDAVDEAYHYIRYPAYWQQVKSNMLAMRDLNLDNLWFELGVTVSLANIFYIQDIIDWRDKFFATDNYNNNIQIYINFAGDWSHGGKVLNIVTADDNLKTKMLKYLSTLTDKNIANSCISMLNAVDCSLNTNNQWIDYLDKLDQLRATDWKTSLSKLHHMS